MAVFLKETFKAEKWRGRCRLPSRTEGPGRGAPPTPRGPAYPELPRFIQVHAGLWVFPHKAKLVHVPRHEGGGQAAAGRGALAVGRSRSHPCFC